MSPNGRRAWRKWCKRARLRMNKHHRALYRGAIMRKKQPERTPLPVKPFTPRSLVGMSQSARKRRSRAVAYLVIVDVTFIEHAETWANAIHSKLFHQRKFPRHQWDLEQYAQVRAKYRIGERLRPCPGCHTCMPGVKGWHIDKVRGRFKMPTIAWSCDGSGVLPARRA